MEHFRGQATRVANNRGGLKWMLQSIHNTAEERHGRVGDQGRSSRRRRKRGSRRFKAPL